MVVLTSFHQPTEGIRHEQKNTTAYLNDSNLGKGTLFIAESCLSWIGSAGNGFSIEYPNISLHAISRDLNAFPEECLFMMLNIALEGEEQENLDPEDSDSEITTQLRFVPEDRGYLDAMFHAMNVCQALHPDPEDSFSDEDSYEDADESIPMDETNSQMANLSIERNNAFFGTVTAPVSLDGRDHQIDMSGSGRSASDRSAMDRLIAGRAADTAAGMAVGRVADTEVDRAAGIAADREVDREADMAVDMAVDRVADRAADRALQTGLGMEEDTENGAGDNTEANSQPSSEYNTSYTGHRRQPSYESGWFDDAEN